MSLTPSQKKKQNQTEIWTKNRDLDKKHGATDGSWRPYRPTQHAQTHANEKLGLSAHPITRASRTCARVHAVQLKNEGARNPEAHARA